ncbi:hypothetical protein D1O30_06650 [Methylocystis hirsuta]|uniref:Uncharacterized protein n=1 Tax=Methylocystis hirsuta TaxID=369798 RepID=A0A3M9XUU0_9HYPH|nr:hypothetical protein D1O30_06650 [Methylocystis hirsuta]
MSRRPARRIVTTAACAPERVPITSNHVIGKESLKIKIVEQVLLEKVCQLFRNRRYEPEPVSL